MDRYIVKVQFSDGDLYRSPSVSREKAQEFKSAWDASIIDGFPVVSVVKAN